MYRDMGPGYKLREGKKTLFPFVQLQPAGIHLPQEFHGVADQQGAKANVQFKCPSLSFAAHLLSDS